MSFEHSQLNYHAHHGFHFLNDYGGYISDSALETRRHQKNHRPHVTFRDDGNDKSDVRDPFRHHHAHFYTDDVDEEAEEFIRLKHKTLESNKQMSIDSD